MPPPGFEPRFSARKAEVIGRTTLQGQWAWRDLNARPLLCLEHSRIRAVLHQTKLQARKQCIFLFFYINILNAPAEIRTRVTAFSLRAKRPYLLRFFLKSSWQGRILTTGLLAHTLKKKYCFYKHY